MRLFYFSHHAELTDAVDAALARVGEARIVDCHSFPDTPLQCSLYQGDAKFDFNIGTDAFHTPTQWIDASIQFFRDRGFRLGIDEPYSGSLLPMKHYNNDIRVKSIMLEVNRKLYMEKNYTRGPLFDKTKEMITEYLKILRVMDVNNLKNAIFDH